MPHETISQPVKPRDLILAYTERNRCMLVVTSTPAEQDTSDTSMIWVRRMRYSLVEKAGCWTLSGPEVYYMEDDNTEDKRQDTSDSDDSFENEDDTLYGKEMTLRWFLDDLAPNCSGEPLRECLVNPHGRDVLKHYFRGCCPYCGYDRFFCLGCGGVIRDFPELFGSCCSFLSCPVCIGYDIALNEKQYLRALEWEEEQLRRYQEKAKESKLSYDDRLELRKHKHEIEDILTEKYETINKRKEKMGLPLDDVDQLVKEYTDCIFD